MTSEKPPIIWLNLTVFITTFFMAIILTPLWAYYHGFDWIQISMFIATFFFSGLSITAGYHRLWCHKAYQAQPSLKRFFAIGGAFAMQNSILHWASDHRYHHRYVDNTIL